jgi:putative transposase
MLCSDRFVDGGVWECWATLLDEGIYLCSESTMHRVLRDHVLAGQRRQRRPGRHPRPRLVATAPNTVWVWDISRLPGPGKGVWFYRYAVWDLWSRKTVGWCVDIVETAEIAEWLMTVTIKREHVDRGQLIIHSDRGAQMTAGTITDLYDMLGIRRSLSRPRVSNDNPHAEAGFKTYRLDWPAQFATLATATLALRNSLRLVQPRPPSHRDRPPDTSGPSRRQRTTNQHRPPVRARQRPPTPPRTIPERATPTAPPTRPSMDQPHRTTRPITPKPNQQKRQTATDTFRDPVARMGVRRVGRRRRPGRHEGVREQRSSVCGTSTTTWSGIRPSRSRPA